MPDHTYDSMVARAANPESGLRITSIAGIRAVLDAAHVPSSSPPKQLPTARAGSTAAGRSSSARSAQ